MILLTKPIQRQLIRAYQRSAETGESADDVAVKFFTPWGGATWYISEGMPVDSDGEPTTPENAADWHLYGFCDIGDPINAELGYVMLSDLTGLRGPWGLRVERDRHYQGTISAIRNKQAA